eukprot:2901144-Alexandrium_andersonii.AAC.1
MLAHRLAGNHCCTHAEACIDVCMWSGMSTCEYAGTNVHARARMHPRVSRQAGRNALVHSGTRALMHSCTHALMHSCAHALMHSRAHACTNSRARAHAYTHQA